MKKFSIICIYILIIAGLILSLAPITWFPSYMDVRYTGWSTLLTGIIIYFLPRLFRAWPGDPDAAKKNRATDLLQFMAALAVMADALGAAGLYQLYQFGIPYNYILHFCVPLISVILLSTFISQRYNLNYVRSVALGFLIILACGIIWEIIETVADMFLGTHLSGPDQSVAVNVSVTDVIVDTIGMIIGVGIMSIRHYIFKTKI